MPHLSYSATCRPNKLILHDFINLTVLGKEKVNKLYKALHDVIFSNSQLYLSGPNIVLRRFFSKTLQLCFGHKKRNSKFHTHTKQEINLLLLRLLNNRGLVLRSGSTLAPTQPVTQRISGDLPTGVQRPGAWRWPLTPTNRLRQEWAEWLPPMPLISSCNVQGQIYIYRQKRRSKALWNEHSRKQSPNIIGDINQQR